MSIPRSGETVKSESNQVMNNFDQVRQDYDSSQESDSSESTPQESLLLSSSKSPPNLPSLG